MKKKYFIITILILVVITAGIYTFFPRMYGNDMESIKKIITNKLDTDQEINVFDTVDYKEYRFAAYLLGNQYQSQVVGYAQFEINKKGNYKFVEIKDWESAVKRAYDVYVKHFNDFIMIMSNNPKLSSMEIIRNNGKTQIIEVAATPTLFIVEDYFSITSYRFLDNEGNELK